MGFRQHSEYSGLHAFLSPSKYSWVRYDEEKLLATFDNYLATAKGTEDHDFASRCIKRRQKLKGGKHDTLVMFVNDAIGFKMDSEVVLKPYEITNCFGTADAISYRDGVLRIHDLKTGKSATHMEQLEIYAALFCLEYGVRPSDIDIILRIYQSGEINEYLPPSDEIDAIIEKIIVFDELIERRKQEV